MANYDAVIAKILIELDTEQAEYQRLYKYFNGKEDILAKHIYGLQKDLCERIRRELSNKRR
jgi:hypothetical protein